MIDWIKAELKRQRKTQRGLARALGRDPAQVSKMLKGQRRITAPELDIIATFLGKPVPTPGAVDARARGLQTVPVTGELAVGHWKERDIEPPSQTVHHVPWIPDPKVVGMAQYARRVETSHTPDVARGDYAIFVRLVDLHRGPRDGELVHVIRRREDLEEHSLRRVVQRGTRVELHIDGQNGQRDPLTWSPINPALVIEGVFIGSFRPPRVAI